MYIAALAIEETTSKFAFDIIVRFFFFTKAKKIILKILLLERKVGPKLRVWIVMRRFTGGVFVPRVVLFPFIFSFSLFNFSFLEF